jgi:Na+/H+ antiporter NhaD/arsenite permease-like protein
MPSQLRISGFFELAARFALRRAHSAPVPLAAIVIVTGFFSAFLANDSTPYDIKPRRGRHERPTGSR